jgi:hypothetical protein
MGSLRIMGGGISIFSAFGNVLISNSTVSGNKSTVDGGSIEIEFDGGDPTRIERSW